MKYLAALKNHLTEVSDPRVLRRSRHQLLDILVLSVLAVVAGAETWIEIERFGASKKAWLKEVLEFPNGIPSHDTISRVFMLIDPREFELAFMSWVDAIRKKCIATNSSSGKDTICVDGKVVAGTVEHRFGHGRSKLNIVSAWSTQTGLVLGQLKSKKGQCETSTAVEILDILEIKDTIIVGDAGIGTRSVVEKIIEREADYVFPVKSNSRGFHKNLTSVFDNLKPIEKKVESYVVEETAHGRHEVRSYSLIRAKDLPVDFNLSSGNGEYFKSLTAIGRVVYERVEKETRPFVQANGSYTATKDGVRRTTEVRYFVTSLKKTSVKTIAEKLRLQWSIENKLHWVLDVSFREDANQTRNRVAAENLALVRKIALNLVRQDTTSKIGVKGRLKIAGWDHSYFEKIVFGKFQPST